jgi:hypothetical protein
VLWLGIVGSKSAPRPDPPDPNIHTPFHTHARQGPVNNNNMVHGSAVGGTGTMLAVASDLQNSLLMMGRGQAPGKRPRISRPNLSHLSSEEKLEVRLDWARVWRLFGLMV